MTRRTKTILAAFGLVVLGAAAYFNSLRGPFIFDDASAITSNSSLRHWRPIGLILAGPRPVVDLTFRLNYSLNRLNVQGYHLFNLAFHILAALALFGIVRRTLTMPVFAGRFDDAAATVLGFCAALIWMVHPLQTESVTYVVQRAESLMGLFYLLTLYVLIRAVSSPRPAAWYATAVVACALGMGCKQVMVTAPATLLLYDRTFIAGSFREALRRRWGFYVALAATWLILAHSILEAFSPNPASAGFALAGVTPLGYARSEPGVVLHYLELTFKPTDLCLDYAWPVATRIWEFVPGAIIVGALLAVALWAVVRWPKWGFPGAWFFLLLAPTSSVLPIRDLAFEHRMYLPLAAPAATAVVAAYLVAERLLRQPRESQEARKHAALGIAALLALCAAAGLGWLTFQRNAQYHSDISIWEDTTRQRPENARAWSGLGQAYDDAARYNDALRVCNRALALDPRTNLFDSATIYCNRGLARAGLGRLTEAIQDYDMAIALKPDYDLAYNDRGLACAKMGRLADAIRDYDKAIALNPEYAQAYESRGIAYARSGRPADALRDFDQAVALNPEYAEAYYNRGNACLDANRNSEAVADYNEAIALKPDFAIAYYNRAVAHYEMKAYDQASTDVKTFIRLGGQPEPGFLEALRHAAEPAQRTQP